MSAKNRKLKYLTYAQRKEIIEKLDQKVSQRKLALEYGVSASTVNAINKPESRNEILQSLQKSSEASNQRKKPPVKYAEMNEKVFQFVEECRANNTRISGPLLKETAKKYAQEMKLEAFTASNGWLSVFCTKYKISFRKPGVSKRETEELSGSVGEDRNLSENNDETALEEHLHVEDVVESSSECTEPVSLVKAESPVLVVSSKKHGFDHTSNHLKRKSGMFPSRTLNGVTSSAPTVLHSNGMVFVTLANGTNVEIGNESIAIHTTTNELVTVLQNTTSVQSGTSHVSIKDGVIQIRPIEDEVLQLQ